MSGIIIKKKNGELVELESDQMIDVADLMEVLGDDSSDKLLEQLISLTKAIKDMPAPTVNVAPEIKTPEVKVDVAAPSVNVAAPEMPCGKGEGEGHGWKSAELKITKWDSRGRIEAMTINKIF